MAVELQVVAALADAASVLSVVAAFVAWELAAVATALLVVAAARPAAAVVEVRFDTVPPVVPFVAAVAAWHRI